MPTPEVPRSPVHALAVALGVAVVLLVAACGGASPTTRPSDAVDRLVDIGHGRLHLWCAGRGDTTVVLVPGWDDGGSRWGGLGTALQADARVCAYARFGTGTSDAPPRVQTFATQADDLHALLAAADEPGPYVLVGHSFGGAEAIAFASRHRDDVRGLVLLDASPRSWPTAVCAVPEDGSDVARLFAATCDQMTDAGANAEHLDAVQAFAEVAATPRLGAVPMVVLTRAAPAYPGLSEPAARALATAWIDGQHEWAALSSKGKVVPVATQEHYLHLAEPVLVADAIRGLLR